MTASAWRHATGELSLDRPRVVGIINVTPDSFSDGGRFRSVGDAVGRAERLVEEGADVVDVGGESTRPQGAEPVALEEERRRVLPVIEGIIERIPGILISVDTTKSHVAREAIAAGAVIVNDVSGFRLDPEMAGVCMDGRAGVVLMHSRGTVQDMASYTHAIYGPDVVGDVLDELETCIATALRTGIAPECIVLDPGIGFAKRSDHSLAVLAGLHRTVARGFPVLIGASRKRFIGELTSEPDPANRVAGTIGVNCAALERGARLFRVHDVRPNREALDAAWAVMSVGPASERPSASGDRPRPGSA